ncbi:MAG: class A beta-lactamase-related serine hydrolase [Anaerolineales bacterium]|nr:class A beta-lactamase-related serine hydrolase [Anaerolineales bacterium]
MNNRNTSFILRGISLVFVILAMVLTMFQLVGYSRQRNQYPAGMTIAGVAVGGVDAQTASERVLQVYTQPIEVQYAGELIHIDPTVVGFNIDTESMLAAADLARTGSSFWGGFWDYLWNRSPAPAAIPLRATLSEERLRTYLQAEIATRYDQPASPAQPIPGNVTFEAGQPGQELNINRAVALIEDALRSPSNRVVSLSFERTAPLRPTMQNLEILLKQIIDIDNFDGVIGIYLLDLQSAQEIHFALNNGTELSVQPDVAFTASSTVKIPIMLSYLIKYGSDQLDDATAELMLEMIQKSENPPADLLMDALDPTIGPLIVTEDMQEIGLENTFIAGYFASGSPLLRRILTPANQRTDVDTDPDAYNQTTPSDIGMLLADLYQCAESGGGALVAAFPTKITQEGCQRMIGFLVKNKIGVLIEAGVPEGTQVAHKHGWVSDNSGVIRNISDSAIVYTPGGNYVLAIYAYHPQQALWDPVSSLFAELSQAVYNFFNLPVS